MTKKQETFVNYLKEIKFERRIEQLNKKLKNKKIVLYATGSFFRAVYENYDLKDLNIVAVSDRSYVAGDSYEKAFGYPKVSLDEINEYSPDYVLVCSQNFVNSIIDLRKKLSPTIKVRPLIKKSIKDLWNDVMFFYR